MLKVLRCGTIASLLVLVVAGCNRDTSSPSKTLIGHWVTAKDNIEIHRCYSEDGIGIFYNKTQDNLERVPYRVVSESPEARTVRVQMVGYSMVEVIAIAPDGKAARVWTEASENYPESHENWKYVDGNANCR